MAIDKYTQLVATRLIEVEAWARDGLTQEQIAHNLGISLSSLKNYAKAHPELMQAMVKGREVADILVENALFKAAIGYQYTEQTATVKGEIVTLTKQAHPNFQAIRLWLNNRKPDTWRDKREIKHDGQISLADVLARAWDEDFEREADEE